MVAFKKGNGMSTPQIKLLLSFLERREIAALLPELSDVMSLDSKNGRVLPLSVKQAESIRYAINNDKRQNRGVVERGLEHAAQLISNSLEEAEGIGAIPVSERLYQFKITLLESQPSIWRRVQVKDSTLDKFHERIQTAMGWTNSHLHQFEIDGDRYGDPELLDDGFEDFECVDSTVTKISEIVPKNGKRFHFVYEYDFGDCWQHEVLFEGCLRANSGSRYPLCVEGEKNCPPEDVGGVGGYAEYLEALADPKHEQHHDMLQWRGPFDPEQFLAEKATKAMRRGLPDWRKME